MTVRATRQLLNALAAVCAVSVVGVAFWAIQPAAVAEPEPLKLRTASHSSSAEKRTKVTSASLLAAASAPLRRPLIDPKPSTTQTRPKPSQTRPVTRTVNPRLTLVATVIEAGRNVAIISDARGRTDLKGVGEKLQLLPSGATIQEIKSDRVTIEFQGRRIPLRLVGNVRGGIPSAPRSMNPQNSERPEAPAFIRDR